MPRHRAVQPRQKHHVPFRSLDLEERTCHQVLSELDSYIEKASKRIASNLRSAEAIDLAQEAKLKLLRNFDEKKFHEISYLKRISVNAMLDVYADERRTDTILVYLEDEQLPPNAVTTMASSWPLKYSVLNWVGRLPKELKKIYYFLYVQGLTQREAAICLRVSQARVSQLHSRLISLGRSELSNLYN